MGQGSRRPRHWIPVPQVTRFDKRLTLQNLGFQMHEVGTVKPGGAGGSNKE